ncbi:ATP-binding protein [Streptomyces sp. NPDC047009]|uniref:ATP-binding protein n=1 Tax=unclassified Streptomyces TaxID=2593676 RepID=UPI0033EE3CA2
MPSTMILTQSRRLFEATIAPELALVPQARNTAFAIMQLWDIDESLAEDVRLTVSELVSNAIEHGTGRVELRMTEMAGKVTVEVSDCNPTSPQIRNPHEDDPRGRGLMIVASLAHRWGVSEDGYSAWAAFLDHSRRAEGGAGA